MSTQKTCPECAAVFSCSTEGGCWCADLPPTLPLADGAACLCPACLRSKIEVVEAWDAVAGEYARKYQDEILMKPVVGEFLREFIAELPKDALICDMGCGPGQVARFLHSEGRRSCGIDLSPGMIAMAKELNPEIPFTAADVFLLDEKETYDAVIGLYFIVNFPVELLSKVFGKLHRVIKPGGKLLLSFHIGSDELFRVDSLWESGKPLSFWFFRPETITQLLEENGFRVEEVKHREPYPEIEYQSRRAYIFTRRKV
jgi:SAM-dependent methyltransferase